MATHWEGKSLSERLGAALLVNGFTAEDFPELCGKVNAQGRAMVHLGGMREAVALRLIAVLESARPGPETSRAAVGPR